LNWSFRRRISSQVSSMRHLASLMDMDSTIGKAKHYTWASSKNRNLKVMELLQI